MNFSTYEQLIGHMRAKCGYAPIAVVSDGFAERLLRGRIDYLTTELNLSKNLWVSARAILSFNVNDDVITASGNMTDFGKPYSVETYDSADPNHQPRPVSIVDPAVLTRSYHGGDPLPVSSSLYKHSAEAVAFWVEGAEWKARLGPRATQFAEYLVLYEPPVAQPDSLDARGFPFQQFEDYLTWCGAEVFLPYCVGWFKEKDMLEECEAIRATVDKMVEAGTLQFSRWRRTNRNGSNFKARGWAYRRRFR
jgi:hypothetical protein